MAVAAYASLLSLLNDLHSLQLPARLRRLHLDINQIQALNEDVHLLLKFVENHSQRKAPEMDGLWRQISEVAAEADDVIDLHVVNQLQNGSAEGDGESELFSFSEDMERVIHKIDLIKTDLKVVEEMLHRDVQTTEQPKVSVSSSATSSTGKSAAVGLDEHVLNIVDLLTRHEPSLQIFPIVGMGGIGKTTLARNVFEHPYIIGHFYTCIWLTISQQYSVQQIVLGLLGKGANNEANESLVQLGEQIHKKLYTERYLIVLDDVWSEKVWEDLQIFFPKNRHGSRVLITTRLLNVAVSLTPKDPYKLSFLNEDQSWKLLSQTIFDQEGCPSSDLEEIGKEIAKSCRGLPLAIVVIGRLLATNSDKSPEYWKCVANNINSFRNLGDEEQCLKVLSLSYDNLPIHLKLCFLYMRVFAEDDHISTSEVIRLWVAKGFIKPVLLQSLEEIAEGYLRDLVDRSLIFVRKSNKISKKIISCGIHDLLRDLCLKETDKEHFLHDPRIQYVNAWESRHVCCFLCRDPTRNVKESAIRKIYLLKCDGCEMMYSVLRLVRVMKIDDNDEFVHPTKTRCLFVCVPNILEFDCLLTWHLHWNLQTLIIMGILINDVVLPQEIWEMPQLRHISIHDYLCESRVALPEPVTTDIEGKNFTILENLRNLGCIFLRYPFTKAIADRIPNVMNLEVDFDLELSCHSILEFAQLHRLEVLEVDHMPGKSIVTFPHSLKILILHNCKVPWNDMTIVGSLPNLEQLQLIFPEQGTEWNPVEGEFQKLKSLEIKYCFDLVWWRADETHFPILQSLSLEYLRSLEEIPSGFAFIDTLHEITLNWCNDSTVNSAKQILKEQQEMGNQSLQLHIIEEGGREYHL